MTDSPGRHPDTPRTPPDAAPLSLADAAVRLGISPDAARKRLERGTLRGEKRNGRWQVSLEPDAAASTDQDATPGDDRTPDASRTPPDAGVIAELRSLWVEERQRADRYLEAATLWQSRALQFEEQLKTLTTGPMDQDAAELIHEDPAVAAQDDSGAPRAGHMEVEPLPPPPAAPGGWRARLAAWLGGSTG